LRNLIVLGAVFASLIAVAHPAQAEGRRFWQCVPFARLASGVEIHGNAHTWWSQASGKYERGKAPRVGAVMSLPRHGGSRLGHVAVVSKLVSDRVVLLDHANWSRRGRIEHGVRAVDVSENGDWSRVRIWFASVGDLGGTTYPVNGFIYGKAAQDAPVMMAAKTDQPTLPAKPQVLAFAQQAVPTSVAFAPMKAGSSLVRSFQMDHAEKRDRTARHEPLLSNDVIELAKLELKESR
jgi:surface antigen